MGVVQFHLGNYEESIAAIRKNLTRNGPKPAAQVFYLAASLVGLGQVDDARKLLDDEGVRKYGYQWQTWVYNHFADKGEYDHLMSKLEPLGVERAPGLVPQGH